MRDRSLGSTIRLKFTTTDSNGAPVAPSSAFAASDFRIYKDGSATEKTTTNGITVTSPFDSVTGRHLIEIDTSNSTGDVGFWASGSMYTVELNTAKTVNSQTVSGLEIGSFSLELQTADIRKANGTAITASSGRMEVNTTHFGGTAGTFSSGRPEVNTTHWSGTAVGSVTINCNMTQISGDSVAADNAESFFDGTGYAGTNNVIPTVSTVTNGVTVTTNNDKTGYSLTQSFPSNFASLAITVGGAVTAGTVSDKTGYSLTPTTGLGNQTANITGNLSGSVGSVTSGVTVTTNNDKTGYSLASGGLSAINTWTVDITGNITGNLSGSVGSVTGNVGGNVVGSVASVTGRVTANTDQWNGVTVTGMPMPTYTQPTGFLAATFPTDPADQSAVEAAITAAIATIPTAGQNADAVWDEAMADHTGSTTYGGRIVRATNSNVSVQITGSNHISADVHAFQTDVIDSDAIATSAVTEIQSGLATAANQTTILDRQAYTLAVLAGACADPQTASETYVLTIGGSTYTVDMAGQTSTGTRTAPTLTKT